MTRSSRRKRARDASEPASSGARRALDATPFTAAEAAQFAEDGFIILRGVIPAAECRRFLRMAVNPAMAKQGILAGDRSTWPREDDEVEDDEGEEGGGAEEAWEEESEASTQATADPDDERAHDLRRGEYDRGICLRGEDGGDHAIPQHDEDSRWPALFGSARLHAVLDSLHGGRDRWSWQHGAAHGVGWIHLRFPVVDGLLWTPPDADSGVWHIDGDTHRLDTEQSVVVLPLVTPIRPGGGGTALLRGSHKHIGRWLASRGEAGVSRGACRGDEDDEVQTYVEELVEKHKDQIVETTGEQGDLLVMHPLLVHAPSDALRCTLMEKEGGGMTAVRHGIRVSFNMSVKWTSPPLAGEHDISPLEDTLVSPIEQGHVRRLWRREAAAEAYPVGV